MENKTFTHKVRDELLDRAKDLVNGPRNKIYGDPEENHKRIADMWGVILKREVSLHEVYLMMVALKMSRLIESPDHKDSWIDLIGYAALGGENEFANGDVYTEERVVAALRATRTYGGEKNRNRRGDERS